MSLINDALKRATQAQPANPAAPEPERPMQPVEQARAVGLPVYFTPVLLFIICGAWWFLLRGWEARRQAGLYPPVVTVQARELAKLTAPAGAAQPTPANRHFKLDQPATPSVASAASAPTEAQAKETASTVGAEVPVQAATVAHDAAPIPAPLKLQGIFYRPTNPSAVVNSRTVFVGDIIANGKVKAIDRQSVTIDLGGETKVLTLEH